MTKRQANRIIALAEQAIDCYESLRRVFYRNAQQDAETINRLIEMLLDTRHESIYDTDTLDWLSGVHKTTKRTLRILDAGVVPDVRDHWDFDHDPDMEETAH